jgi:hypothetical protein
MRKFDREGRVVLAKLSREGIPQAFTFVQVFLSMGGRYLLRIQNLARISIY